MTLSAAIEFTGSAAPFGEVPDPELADGDVHPRPSSCALRPTTSRVLDPSFGGVSLLSSPHKGD
jgi:hypothetical protein